MSPSQLACAGALALSAALPAAAQTASTAPPPACKSAEHRAFDFWLGEWNVHGAKGNLAGTNSIKSEHGGCVIHERYDTGRGYTGESLNIYDAARKVWHQSWVDSSGLLLTMEGGIRGGAMVMEGQTTGADGKVTKHRMTWTPNADGSVRQLWEQTNAAGEWTVGFDGRYTKR
ncbi:MAG TPA: hypothetical protein VGE47_04695 [Burkholderiaceae bacterium]